MRCFRNLVLTTLVLGLGSAVGSSQSLAEVDRYIARPGQALAYKLGAGVVLVRKPGKLPYKTHKVSYSLEYGKDTLEIHQDAIKKGQRVIIADDLLATGGTARAVVDLVNKAGGKIIECAFLVELTELKGRERLSPRKVFSLVQF